MMDTLETTTTLADTLVTVIQYAMDVQAPMLITAQPVAIMRTYIRDTVDVMMVGLDMTALSPMQPGQLITTMETAIMHVEEPATALMPVTVTPVDHTHILTTGVIVLVIKDMQDSIVDITTPMQMPVQPATIHVPEVAMDLRCMTV